MTDVEGRTDLRVRNRRRTYEDLAGAALDLFETKGYDGTTNEDIAAAAGTSVRTFYRYFDSKNDVLFVHRSDEAGPGAALAEVRGAAAGEPLPEVLRRALQHPVRALELNRDVVVRQFAVILGTPSLDALRREQFHRFEDPLAEALRERLDADPTSLLHRWLAAACASALRIAIERWIATGAAPGALAALLDEGLEVVFAGPAGLDASTPRHAGQTADVRPGGGG